MRLRSQDQRVSCAPNFLPENFLGYVTETIWLSNRIISSCEKLSRPRVVQKNKNERQTKKSNINLGSKIGKLYVGL